MSDNVYAQINDRSKLIFKKLVESYLKTGSPAGSETIMKMGGLNLSSASIRSILSNLQKEGLLYAPHRSAGRMPTEKGMRFFVDGLLEFGRISKIDKENIKQQCLTKGKSYEEVLDVASKAISGLSSYAGIVIAPKFQKNIKHVEFIRLNSSQLMLILAYENGEVENRIIEDNGKYIIEGVAGKIFYENNFMENCLKQEEEWCDYLFGNGSMIGLNAILLKDYVRWIGAKRIKSLGYDVPYHVHLHNPLPWTEKWISGGAVQVAPQETEITSYVLGGVKRVNHSYQV